MGFREFQEQIELQNLKNFALLIMILINIRNTRYFCRTVQINAQIKLLLKLVLLFIFSNKNLCLDG